MKKMLNPYPILGIILSASLITGITLPGAAVAHGGASGIVKERMTLMKHLGKGMKKMGAMIKGKRTFDSEQIANHAKTISETAPGITDLFPHGSFHEPSEALPAIREEWEQFSALAQKLTDEAQKLHQVAQSGERRAITMQFAKVGKVCSSCHTKYRKKDEE